METQFIRVNKIMDRDDNNKTGNYETEAENILVSDVKGFRKYKKNGQYGNINGDICQVQVKAETGKGGFYTMRIHESEEAFGNRLGKVIPLSVG